MPIDKGNAIPLRYGNMKCLRIFLTTSFLLCPTVIFADIYRTVDKDGVLHFTNTPRDSKAELYLREAPEPRPRGRSPGPENTWVMEYVERVSRAHNLPPALVKAIIRAESNGNRFAVSPKGAEGIMQLMPVTQRQMNVSQPFDPVENIAGGVRYIKELLGTFDGKTEHAVAAYNAGPAAVKKYGGIPPYAETRVFVERVMDYYSQYQAAE